MNQQIADNLAQLQQEAEAAGESPLALLLQTVEAHWRADTLIGLFRHCRGFTPDDAIAIKMRPTVGQAPKRDEWADQITGRVSDQEC